MAKKFDIAERVKGMVQQSITQPETPAQLAQTVSPEQLVEHVPLVKSVPQVLSEQPIQQTQSTHSAQSALPAQAALSAQQAQVAQPAQLMQPAQPEHIVQDVVRLNLAIPKEQHNDLKVISALRQKSLTKLINAAINEYIKSNQSLIKKYAEISKNIS